MSDEGEPSPRDLAMLIVADIVNKGGENLHTSDMIGIAQVFASVAVADALKSAYVIREDDPV